MTLVPLPPRSPGLNPIERVWLSLKQRSHRVFEDYDAILEAACAAWTRRTGEPAHRLPRLLPPDQNDAFTFGVVPLYISTGAGAELRIALGTAVFWGMIGVTVFGLVFTPVFYCVVRSFSASRRLNPNPVPAE